MFIGRGLDVRDCGLLDHKASRISFIFPKGEGQEESIITVRFLAPSDGKL